MSAISPLWIVFAGLVSALVCLPLLIAGQRRARLGQHVYEDAPATHATKQGTPTMGGIAFLVAAIVGYVLGGLRADTLPLLCLTLAAGLIGLADDLLIMRARRALGLRARAKFSLVALAAIGYVAWVAHADPASGLQSWFGATVHMPGTAWGVLAVLAVVGTANAVNLTDGLDGLAAGVALPAIVGVGLTARAQTLAAGQPIGDAMVGSLFAFLWFNRHPARIFMGDTGSLALGALLAGLAIQAHALLLLPLFGCVFVVEALSVMLQVVSFQTTGRRIFRMSPLHHHFELSGWRETAVTATFVMVSLVASAATWGAWWSTNLRASPGL